MCWKTPNRFLYFLYVSVFFTNFVASKFKSYMYMKNNSLLILMIFALCFISSCVVPTTNKEKKNRFANAQQEHFDDKLKYFDTKKYDYRNDILKKEYLDSVRLATGLYMDSVKLFVNWKAKIQNIKSRENNGNVILSFELEYQPEEYRKVAFDVDYVLPNNEDTLKKDKIYSTVRNLSELSDVYFDGFIRTKANNEAHYSGYFSSASDDMFLSYPDFHFFIVDINAASKGDTLSNDLQKAVDLSFEALEPLKLNFKKEISDKEKNDRIKAIAPEFTSAKEKLSEEDKGYINRLTNAITLNFLYAK